MSIFGKQIKQEKEIVSVDTILLNPKDSTDMSVYLVNSVERHTNAVSTLMIFRSLKAAKAWAYSDACQSTAYDDLEVVERAVN